MNTVASQPVVTCGLCGYEFLQGENTKCTGCPFSKGCKLICCPNCGYEFVNESYTVHFIQSLLDFWRRKRGAAA